MVNLYGLFLVVNSLMINFCFQWMDNSSWNVYVKMEVKLKLITIFKAALRYMFRRLLKEIQFSLVTIMQVKSIIIYSVGVCCGIISVIF